MSSNLRALKTSAETQTALGKIGIMDDAQTAQEENTSKKKQILVTLLEAVEQDLLII